MSEELKKNDDERFIPMTSVSGGKEREIRDDIYYYTNQIVNVIAIGRPGKGEWVLVDTGMPKGTNAVLSAVEKRFGENNRPAAIILTHGHFDHVGTVIDLVEKWQVPVYAHPGEFPYLTGEKSYPEPDATVEGGMLAKMSSIYPHEPINIRQVLRPLPEDHSVPHLPDWKWIHTPGHTPGHVSLFREADRALIAGDAFVTVRQDSFYKVLVQKKEVNGPPRYLTPDWKAAWDSVRKLQALNPQSAVTGHGSAMEGEELRNGLEKLVKDFREMAIPQYGKYVEEDRPE